MHDVTHAVLLKVALLFICHRMRTCWLNIMLPDGDDVDVPPFCRSGTLLDRSVSGVSHMPTTATLTVGLLCVCQYEPV